jgi:putative chitinase
MITNPIDFQQYRNIPHFDNGECFLNADIIHQIFPGLTTAKSQTISDALNPACVKYGLNKPGLFHEFIATCGEESNNFTVFEENLFYTNAARLITVFSKKRFPTLNFASGYLRNPQKLANYVYANRNGNGDVASEDGWKYRGGGPIQCTGKDMYSAYAKYINQPLADITEKIRTDLDTGIDCACWIFVVVKQLLDEAANDQFELITRKINGDLTNFADRKIILARAKKALPIS